VKKVLIALGVVALLLAGFAAYVALQPSDLRVERSAKIAAPPATVFAQVNDFHKWDQWSPWAKLDPQMKQTYEGAAAGEGAVYTWSGDGNVGAGKMTIVESKPAELVRIKLEFVKPFPGTNETAFTFKPEGNDTLVTWTMTGQCNFVGKALGLFMNMEQMIGTMYEKGLADMKRIAEAEAAKTPTASR
jgi:uncharacterized protein YndB with AHSA1/START domain